MLRAHKLWQSYLERHGALRLIFDKGDLRESVSRQLKGGRHQIGTTRMSHAPEGGVWHRT